MWNDNDDDDMDDDDDDDMDDDDDIRSAQRDATPDEGGQMSDERSSLSFAESRVADGMAMALRPAESMAQQSEHPSVIQSSSPGRSNFSTGRL